MLITCHSRAGGNPWQEEVYSYGFPIKELGNDRRPAHVMTGVAFYPHHCHSRAGGNPYAYSTSDVSILSHSRAGGNPWLEEVYSYGFPIKELGNDRWGVLSGVANLRTGGGMFCKNLLHYVFPYVQRNSIIQCSAC